MRCHAVLMDPIDTVRRYAEAWQANDIAAVFDLYHDEFVLHYFGTSPLAGDHVGKEAAIEVLVEATQRSGRQLDAIEDVLGGDRSPQSSPARASGSGSRMVRRVFVYTVRDGKLAECWLYDEDQRFDRHALEYPSRRGVKWAHATRLPAHHSPITTGMTHSARARWIAGSAVELCSPLAASS